jgi:hypothetical protein
MVLVPPGDRNHKVVTTVATGRLSCATPGGPGTQTRKTKLPEIARSASNFREHFI